jgi:hypothetical protein
MQVAINDCANSKNALVVVNESLPAIVQGAEELSKDEKEPVISGTIVSMAATIKLLTESGTPGHLAVPIAGVDAIWRSIKGWLKRDKSKDE